MSILILAILIFLAFFFIKGGRASIFLIAATYHTFNLFGIKFITIVMALLIGWMIVTKKKFYLNKFPWLWGFVVCFGSYFLTYFFIDGMKHLNPIVNAFSTFFFPYIFWRFYRPSGGGKGTDCHKFTKYLMIFLVVLFVYSLYEITTIQNPFVNALLKEDLTNYEQGDEYIRAGIYRARSLTPWCSAYGAACGLGLTLLLNMMLRGYIKKSVWKYLLLACLAAGVVISGTRSIMVMTAICVCSVLPLFIKNFKSLVPLLLLLGILVFANWSIIDETVDSIIHHEDAGGSSLEMRNMQYAAAYHFYEKSPVLGNGLAASGEAASINAQLLGVESIIFKTMINRGLVGLASLIFLLINSIYVLCRKRCYSLIFIVLGFAFGKVISALIGSPETFVFFYIIPLMAEMTCEKNKVKTSTELSRINKIT